ncbi:hypothetical protein ABK040_007225 [Willaertia magna]
MSQLLVTPTNSPSSTAVEFGGKKKTKKKERKTLLLKHFKTSNALVVLFIFQGLFALSCSFLLLYTTSNYLIVRHQSYQTLEIQSFLNYQLSTFFMSIASFTESLKNQLYFSNPPFNINDPLRVLKLFESIDLVYYDLIVNAYNFCLFNNFTLSRALDSYRYFDPRDGVFMYYSTKRQNYDYLENYYNSSQILRAEPNSTFFCAARPWFRPFATNQMTDIGWSQVFANKAGEMAISLSFPLYINEKVEKIPLYYSFNTSHPLYVVNTVTHPEYRNSSYLFGGISAQFSLNRLSTILQNQNLQYVQAIYVLNNGMDKLIIANYTKLNSFNFTQLSDMALNNVEKLDHCEEYNRNLPYNMNPFKYVYSINVTFKTTVYYKDYVIGVNSICDSYGLSWNVVIISKHLNLFQTILETQREYFISFITVFTVVFIIMTLIVKIVSSTVTTISTMTLSIINFTFKEKHHRIFNLFYDFRRMNNVLLILNDTLLVFSKYIPNSILNKILKKDNPHYDNSEMREKNVIICFIQLVCVGELLDEGNKQQQVDLRKELLQEINNSFTNILESYHGVVSQFLFDGRIICYFHRDYIKPHVNPSIENACRASIDILSKANVIAKKYKEQIPSIEQLTKVKIALHSGKVFIGTFGGDLGFNFTAIGREMDLCSNILKLNCLLFKANSIFISNEFYKKIKHLFLCNFVDFISVNDNDDSGLNLEAIYTLESLLEKASEKEKKVHDSLKVIQKDLLEKKWEEIVEVCDNILMYCSGCEAAEHLKKRMVSFNGNIYCKKF